MGAPRIDALDRNLLLNGGMNINQRYVTASNQINLTSVSSLGAYYMDRWKRFVNRVTNNQNYTWSAQTDVPAYSLLSYNFPQSVRVTSNQAHSFAGEDRINPFYQQIEGTMLRLVSVLDKIYLVGAIKMNLTSPVDCTIPVSIAQYTSGSVVVQSYVFEVVIPASQNGQWIKIEKEIPAPGGAYLFTTEPSLQVSVGGITSAAGSYVTSSVDQWVAGHKLVTANTTNWANANGNWLQFVGFNLSKFPLTSFSLAAGNEGNEQILLRRYYEKSYDLAVVPGTPGVTGHAGGYHQRTLTAGIAITQFSVRKRATPVMRIFAPNDGVEGNLTIFPSTSASINGVVPAQSSFDVVANQTAGVSSLGWHWTADADY